MYRLKQVIDNIGENRTINKDLYVKDNKVFLTTEEAEFKYEYGNWYQNCGGIWVNLQGGIPDYKLETNPDADVFEPIEIEQDV